MFLAFLVSLAFIAMHQLSGMAHASAATQLDSVHSVGTHGMSHDMSIHHPMNHHLTRDQMSAVDTELPSSNPSGCGDMHDDCVATLAHSTSIGTLTSSVKWPPSGQEDVYPIIRSNASGSDPPDLTELSISRT